MTANDSKSYLTYLNKLIVQYNFTYHHSISKKPISDDYSDLTDEIETNVKALKLIKESKLLSIKNIFSKGYSENWSRDSS